MSKKALVTGCAGFIGSHLCENLLDRGYQVIGIDCFTDYYDRNLKVKNLYACIGNDDFFFIENDLREVKLYDYLKDIDFIFHQAGQPGVRGSWGNEFDVYTKNNILATQYLLEHVKNHPIKKMVYASSSSIYGNIKELPMREGDLPKPFSPYGVSKLAAENLCNLYHENYGVPVISLRYFTVYGPRQRPEMAISLFIQKILKGETISIYGDGNQGRDFTYIDDIVCANILVAKSSLEGETFNVGSGHPIKVIDLIGILENIIGKKANIKFIEKQKGDVRDTYADISEIQNRLDFKPTFSIEEGLRNQVEYMKNT
ncbi:NAD-dependent epimerase/dehydratase family protein [Marinisporobacter balticus]|uniref:UDP-glucose 4-epimerase n=1 Tax=Marinisporobacter balticus TaxID=2018667 RepID=A0A4R2KFM0_9FIRM|nr:NAD-dependent epimerase/dehydratase family protein [Marinisporobacter balticus]TCO71027.1 UDP-glucose 4-epimerase [Marinisporobacter balticus]